MDFSHLFDPYNSVASRADFAFQRIEREFPECMRCRIGCSDCCHAVFGLFLIEAVFLTATGGLIGILVGFGIAQLVKTATPLPASVTGWSVILGFAVSVSVGIFFGIFPARMAANLDPIVSLRYE